MADKTDLWLRKGGYPITDYIIPSLQSAIKVLKHLSLQEYQESTLSQISSAMSISTSTCLRILRTLQQEGMVIYNENNKRYRLGPALIELGTRAADSLDYIRLAKAHLPDMAEDFGMTVVMARRVSRDRIAYIAKEEPKGHVRLTVSVGEEFPIIAAAVGKCFMAYLNRDEAKQLVEENSVKGQLPEFTPNSTRDTEEYFAMLDYIRKLGYAESKEEYSPGISAIATPIFNSSGEVVLVVSCMYPASTFMKVNSKVIAEKLKQYSQIITDEIRSIV